MGLLCVLLGLPNFCIGIILLGPHNFDVQGYVFNLSPLILYRRVVPLYCVLGMAWDHLEITKTCDWTAGSQTISRVKIKIVGTVIV